MKIIFLLLLLIGCTAPPVVTRDLWTGNTLAVTKAYEISRTLDAIVEVRPVIGNIDGVMRYAVLTNVRRLDQNGPRIDRITTTSEPLDYRRHDRLRTHCIDGCRFAEIGAIHLDVSAFEDASKQGLALRIWGKRGRYEGTIPADAFQTALLNARYLN